MVNFTCKGCTNRHVGCHATCQAYIKAAEAKQRDKEILRELAHSDWDYQDYQCRRKGTRKWGNKT